MMTVGQRRDIGAHESRPAVRRRERRRGVGCLLTALAGHVRIGGDAISLRSRLEDGLRELLGARAVCVRERPAPCLAPPLLGSVSADTLVIDVPTREARSRVVLEAQVASRTALDDWDRQILSMGANLAALVVELERWRQGVDQRTMGLCRRSPATAGELVGSSALMVGLREHVARVAASPFTVLIEGESGTGKELVARLIHQLGTRRGGPFVAVNCAAIVDTLLEAELFGIEDRTATGVRGRRGKFEHADGGTLFLDEVSDLAPSAQAKLLRVIQELTVERVGGHVSRPVDTRIIAATNKSLRRLVAEGLFREDLYYRLAGVEVRVPPLRDRRTDIAELSAHFLRRCDPGRARSLTSGALEVLRVYDWPGNVRELERVIEGAVTMARQDSIGVSELSASVRGCYEDILTPSLLRNDSMRAWGARYARLVLERCGHNKRQACRVLDISYHTLQAYLRWSPREPRGPGEELPDAGALLAETDGAPCGDDPVLLEA